MTHTQITETTDAPVARTQVLSIAGAGNYHVVCTEHGIIARITPEDGEKWTAARARGIASRYAHLDEAHA